MSIVEKQNVLGVVGLSEGRSILSAAITSEMWRLGGICDLNADLMERRRSEFGLDPSLMTTRYESLLQRSEIDTVAIFTPNALHADHICAALEAGKDVICTKPLIDDLSDARRLLDTAERTGRLIYVGQSTRFMESMIRQRQDVEAGLLGEILSVEAHYHDDKRKSMATSWKRDWLFTGLVHPVDLIASYLPDIIDVSGVGVSHLPDNDDVPENLHVIVRSASGAVGTASGCYGCPAPVGALQDMISCTIRGTRGTSHAAFNAMKYARRLDGGGEEVFDLADRAPYYFRFENKTHHAGEFQNYIEHFARCRSEGVTPLPDVREGLRTIAVLAAVGRSAMTGQVCHVDDMLRAADLTELCTQYPANATLAATR